MGKTDRKEKKAIKRKLNASRKDVPSPKRSSKTLKSVSKNKQDSFRRNKHNRRSTWSTTESEINEMQMSETGYASNCPGSSGTIRNNKQEPIRKNDVAPSSGRNTRSFIESGMSKKRVSPAGSESSTESSGSVTSNKLDSERRNEKRVGTVMGKTKRKEMKAKKRKLNAPTKDVPSSKTSSKTLKSVSNNKQDSLGRNEQNRRSIRSTTESEMSEMQMVETGYASNCTGSSGTVQNNRQEPVRKNDVASSSGRNTRSFIESGMSKKQVSPADSASSAESSGSVTNNIQQDPERRNEKHVGKVMGKTKRKEMKAKKSKLNAPTKDVPSPKRSSITLKSVSNYKQDSLRRNEQNRRSTRSTMESEMCEMQMAETGYASNCTGSSGTIRNNKQEPVRKNDVASSSGRITRSFIESGMSKKRVSPAGSASTIESSGSVMNNKQDPERRNEKHVGTVMGKTKRKETKAKKSKLNAPRKDVPSPKRSSKTLKSVSNNKQDSLRRNKQNRKSIRSTTESEMSEIQMAETGYASNCTGSSGTIRNNKQEPVRKNDVASSSGRITRSFIESGMSKKQVSPAGSASSTESSGSVMINKQDPERRNEKRVGTVMGKTKRKGMNAKKRELNAPTKDVPPPKRSRKTLKSVSNNKEDSLRRNEQNRRSTRSTMESVMSEMQMAETGYASNCTGSSGTIQNNKQEPLRKNDVASSSGRNTQSFIETRMSKRRVSPAGSASSTESTGSVTNNKQDSEKRNDIPSSRRIAPRRSTRMRSSKGNAPPPKKVTARLKEIQRLQKQITGLIPKLPFSKLVREIMQKYCDFHISAEALVGIQAAAELYLLHYFEDSNKCCLHAKRVTLKLIDMQLVGAVRAAFDKVGVPY